MNLRVYNAKDKLRETIDAMAYVRSKEELINCLRMLYRNSLIMIKN